MFLVGTYELVVDNKCRLSIPFAVRKKLSDERDGHSFYVMPGRRAGTLSLYPEKYYDRLRTGLPADDRLSDMAYAYRQFDYSQTALLEPDGQGRVLLPERLLKRAGLEREVVLIAVGDHLELWRRDEFRKFEESMWPDYWQQRAKALEEMNRLAPAKAAHQVEPPDAPAG